MSLSSTKRLLLFSIMSWLRCCITKKGLGFCSFPLIGSQQVPRDRGSPGRNRKPPFGALVTLIINTIVLCIVIIMTTVVLCIVPRWLPCCSDYYRDSLSVAGVPLITATSAVPEMVPGNWLFSSHIQSLTMPLPVSPRWFLQT